ncbi:hypothetical protein FDN13_13965 [Caloramator sp. E03]|uniref:hypothetical protein n=1 Tax=Caloramator sp. E03 TaxID=2576307 RepID=UPI001110B263|nr:hypothetical protein [Caloramator sp. E03]QCX34719.1 hypothetical protein FDN13_13965 [Caloramator sp. E03]
MRIKKVKLKNIRKFGIKGKNVKEIIGLVMNTKVLEKAKKLADKYTKKAFNNIEKLPDCDAKEILKEVTQKTINS